MLFSFNVNITEKDYIDFNMFCILNTPFGKKQLKSFRIINSAILIMGLVACLLIAGFTPVGFCSTVLFLCALAAIQACAPKLMTASVKAQAKKLSRSGKKAYSPCSVLEFYGETFTETDDEAKTEQKYSSIDRISIIENRIIYIHINDLRAYLLPLSCFESPRQYAEFVAFIRKKCDKVDVY